MNSPVVSITIVTWNSSNTIKACLESVSNQTFPNLEIIVVDNNSNDGTTTALQGYPLLRIFPQGANLGFCRGHNIAIDLAKGKYILPLNPDVVMTKTYIENLVRAAETDDNVGMVAGKLLLNQDENHSPTRVLIDSTGLFLDKQRRQFLRSHREIDTDLYDKQEYVFGADGAAPLYRKEMLEACKYEGQYFDENFFAYKEDVDLAWRAQLFGWKCLYCPDAVAFHTRTFKPGQREGMSREARMHSVKNRYLLLLKNELPYTFVRHIWSILLYDLKILGYLVLFEQFSLRGLWQVIKLLPQTLRWRNFIMTHKKVEGSYMLNWMNR